MKIFAVAKLRLAPALSVAAAAAILLSGCGGGDSGANSGGGGDSYESVAIGGKRWMKKNLDVVTADSWCYGEDGQVLVDYDADDNPIFGTLTSSEIQANCGTYGRLYTWAAAKAACQSMGWRLPDTSDWNALVELAGGRAAAGKALKSTRGWGNNGNGTDAYGFSGLPGGGHLDGILGGVGNFGMWWANGGYSGDEAYFIAMGYNFDYVVKDDCKGGRCYAFSVRCLEDD